MINIENLKLSSQDFTSNLKEAGVYLFPWDKKRVRAIFHIDIAKEDAIKAAEIVNKFVYSLRLPM